MAIEKIILPLVGAAFGAAGLQAQTPASTPEPPQPQSWTKEQVHEFVWKVVSKNSGVPEDQIKPEQDMVKHLGMDSLDYVVVIVDVEHHFGVTFPDEMLDKVKTVGELEEWVLGVIPAE